MATKYRIAVPATLYFDAEFDGEPTAVNKQEALWEVMDASKETKRASDSGILDLSEHKQVWRDAVKVARAAGATDQEIAEAEKEGQE